VCDSAHTLCGIRERLAERIEAMDLAPDVVRMMRDRPACQVWLTVLQPGEAKDLDDVARTAGLEPGASAAILPAMQTASVIDGWECQSWSTL
jgi:hypothetical protein